MNVEDVGGGDGHLERFSEAGGHPQKPVLGDDADFTRVDVTPKIRMDPSVIPALSGNR